MDVQKLLDTYPILSDQVTKTELRLILEYAAAVLERADGDIVEFGCYVGTTSVFLQRLARPFGRALFVYDSFQGLPDKTEADLSPAGEQFKAGELLAPKATFIKHFKQAGLPLPVIKKAWFEDLTPADVPDRIAVAFLDGDYFESVRIPLRLIEKKMSAAGVIIIDDYQNEALPGAAKATDEWLRTHPEWRLRRQASLAILTRS